MGEYKVCKRCTLNTFLEGTVIGEDGVCSECSSYKDETAFSNKLNKMLTKKMEVLFEKVKKEKRAYDVLVLFSGGKDSTYVLNMVKTRYNLNPLAFSVMHPLMSQTASRNIEEVTKKLGVDLYKFFPDESMYKKIIRYGMLEGYKYGMDEGLGCKICSGTYIWPSIKMAIKLGIPIVMDGVDRAESFAPIYGEGDKISLDARNGLRPLGVVHDIFRDALGEDNRMYDYDIDMETDRFPTIISPLTFLSYDLNDGYREIEKLGIDSKKYRKVFTRCSVIPFFAYITLKKFGCVPFVKQFARGIRNGNSILRQLKIDSPVDDESFDRAATLKIIEEYENIVTYVAEKEIKKESIEPGVKENLLKMVGFSVETFGIEAAEVLINEVLMINYYARYFEIDLKCV